jgi:hypothetical protein
MYHIPCDLPRNPLQVHVVVGEACLGASAVAFLALAVIWIVYNQVKEPHQGCLQVPATPLILKVLKLLIMGWLTHIQHHMILKAIRTLLVLNWRDRTRPNPYMLISIPNT